MMFAEGEVLRNRHTGALVTVTDVLNVKGASNPVFQVLDSEGQTYRMDTPSAELYGQSVDMFVLFAPRPVRGLPRYLQV